MFDYSIDFALDNKLIYLNHAAVSPWPRVTGKAIEKFTQENTRYGASHYPHWLKVEKALKQKLALLLNSPSENDIALVKNTSEALSMVAYGLSWQAGDNIVIAHQEFPSNRIIWQSLQQFGVSIKWVDLNSHATPEEAYLKAIDSKTRLISVSSVQYADGLRMDLKTLGQYCKQHHILFCVDAIQSLGALKLDVQEIEADFVMADGHKWLLSPEGLGVFYCREAVRAQLQPSQFGWHMTEDIYNFDTLQWTAAETARKFECGSPNMLAIHALYSSVCLLMDRCINTIERKVVQNTRYLAGKLSEMDGIKIVSRLEQERLSGIIAFRHRTVSSEQLYQSLMEKQVICAMRHGNVRFSAHYYTRKATLDRAIEILKELIVQEL